MPRIGPGWIRCDAPTGSPPSPVWKHDSGVRIHVGGMILFPDGRTLWRNRWPESKRIDWAIRVHGGNVRRGLMAVAMEGFEPCP